MEAFSFFPSPLGELILASDGESLTGLWFSGQKHAPAPPAGPARDDLPVFAQARAWLAAYFQCPCAEIEKRIRWYRESGQCTLFR